MASQEPDISTLSPQKLIEPFSKTRIWQYLAIAVAVHVVVILVTSIGYLRGRITGEKPAAKVPAEEQQPAAAQPETPTPTPAAATTQPETTTTTGGTTDDQQQELMDKYKDTKVIQNITEKAKPEDIPAAPDLGISIEDTKIE